MAFAKRSTGGHNAKAQTEADETYDRTLEKLESFLDATSNDDGHKALTLAQRLEALMDGGVLAALLNNDSINPLTLGAGSPAPAPLVLGAGSPAPAPVAPVAPTAPSQAEQIGQDFLNRFPTADVTGVMDFLDNARKTGVTFERSVRALQSIGGSPNPDQLLDLLEQLVTRVKSGRESLITDPSNGTVSLKTIADFTTREVSLKQDLLDIASAIKGSPVTITAAGTRPVVQSATAAANTLRTERAELVDAIVREFSVTGPTGSQTMAAFVAAAKAAVAGTTAPMPAPTGVIIDLLTEINTTTPIKKEASETGRAYADRIIKVLVGAAATEMLCDNMVADNGLVSIRPDMDLLHKTHALFGRLAARRLPMTAYVVSAMPTI